jgi:putative glycosyltransferase
MKLSIVTTLYCSELYVQEFYDRSTTVAKQFADDDYEIIFVDDGSPDQSLKIATNILEKDSHVKVIELSRNFGHHKAIMTGLIHAAGEFVFLIDSDLEEEPEWLIPFAEQMKNENCDVVYGVQEARKGNWLERFSGPLYYKIFNYFSDMDMSPNITTARLMKFRYVESLVQFKEQEIVIAGLWYITGFNQQFHVIKKKSLSPTTYTLSKKINMLVSAITNFSAKPLVLICFTGLIISFLALGYAGYLVLGRLFFSTTLSGWTSVMTSIWLIGGLIIFFMGILGIYISKIFIEVKQRPYTIIKKIHGE